MKVKLKKIALLFCIVGSSLFYTAAQADAAASDTLTNLLLNIHTLQANFTQTIKDKSAKTLQQSEGNLAIERPGKFRWEVKKPTPQLIVANGARLWIYDPDLEQVTVRKISKAAGQTPAALLSDKSLTLGKDFIVQTSKKTSQIAGVEGFTLTPKEKDDPMQMIKLSFLNKQIQEMQLQDHLGHTTIIVFQHVKTGMSLPNSLFTFKPSAKIDVIDETTN